MTTRTPHELAVEEIENAYSCFNAAYHEGLLDKLAEQTDTDTGSLHDLVTRRILYAINHLDAALEALRAQKPVDVEKAKQETGRTLSRLIPNSYSEVTMLNTIDHLSTKYNLTEKE
jgi:hypothetical protein